MKQKIYAIVSILFLLLGCTHTEDMSEYYISYTLTKREGENTIIEVHCYDFANETDEVILEIPYTTQYPLASYDKANAKVYYTFKVNDGDQVFEYDVNTKKHTQLTDSLFAVNYLIPCKSSLFIAAIPKDSKNHTQQLFMYKNSSLNTISRNKDFNISALFYDPISTEFILSGSLLKNNEKQQKSHIYSKHMIYTMNEEGKFQNKLYETKIGKITSITGNKRYIYTTNNANNNLEIINRHSGKLDEIVNKSGYRLFYVTNNDVVFYYSNEEIYTYNMNSKEKITLCKTKKKETAIHNAVLLKKQDD